MLAGARSDMAKSIERSLNLPQLGVRWNFMTFLWSVYRPFDLLAVCHVVQIASSLFKYLVEFESLFVFLRVISTCRSELPCRLCEIIVAEDQGRRACSLCVFCWFFQKQSQVTTKPLALMMILFPCWNIRTHSRVFLAYREPGRALERCLYFRKTRGRDGLAFHFDAEQSDTMICDHVKQDPNPKALAQSLVKNTNDL